MATPNMLLPVPVVNVTPGSDYATLEVACFNQIDEHDHTAGKGVAIPTSGININANLPMNNFGLLNTKSMTLTAQSTTQPNQSVYVSGVDLYFRDGSGNNIRITQGGSVTGASGTITGLPSTPPKSASVAFVDATNSYRFQSDSNVAGIVDCRDLWLRNATAGSFKMTVSPPSLGADTSIVLPARPAVTSIVTMDASGNIAANYVVDNSTIEVSANTIRVKNSGITQAKMAANSVGTSQIIDANVTKPKLAALGQQLSASSGLAVYSGAGVGQVTNLSVTITTTGRPVMIQCVAEDYPTAGASSYIRAAVTSGTICQLAASIYRGATKIYSTLIGVKFATSANYEILYSPSSVSYVDTPAAGTYTYEVWSENFFASNTSTWAHIKLLVYEL